VSLKGTASAQQDVKSGHQAVSIDHFLLGVGEMQPQTAHLFAFGLGMYRIVENQVTCNNGCSGTPDAFRSFCPQASMFCLPPGFICSRKRSIQVCATCSADQGHLLKKQDNPERLMRSPTTRSSLVIVLRSSQSI
jgi:hypothetical protein